MKAKNLLILIIATVWLVLFALPVIVVTLLGRFAQLISARSAATEPAVDFDTSHEEIPPFIASKILIRARSAAPEPAVYFDISHEELPPAVASKIAID
jgi:hypothetical protein